VICTACKLEKTTCKENRLRYSSLQSTMSHTTLHLLYTVTSSIANGMDKVFTVYLARHPRLGTYVGCTSMSVQQRRYFHERAAKNAKTPFHKALSTSTSGWAWSVLHSTTDQDEAFAREESEIRSRPNSLNVRIGWHNKPGIPYGGSKNKGRKMSESTRAWFREFHATRPRKHKYDRAEMLRLFNEGMAIGEISKLLGCDQALVSRVVNGVYRQN